MRKPYLYFGYVFAFLTLSNVLTPADAPVPPEIENEQILGINKQPYHATLMPYATRAEALAGNRHASSWSRSLNGQWKFNWVPRPEQRPVDCRRLYYRCAGSIPDIFRNNYTTANPSYQ